MPHTRIGQYRVLVGNRAVPFWPLTPGTQVATVLADNAVAPNDPDSHNTVVLPPRFGLFDVVIQMSDQVDERQLTDAQSVDLLGHTINGPPTVREMPLWERDGGTPAAQFSRFPLWRGTDTGRQNNRVARFCFGVRIAQDQDHFEGVLELRARNFGRRYQARLPIRVDVHRRIDDLFVFFVTRRRSPVPERYCWVTQPVTTWMPPGFLGPLVPQIGVDVELKLLHSRRHNRQGVRTRRVTLRTDAHGFAAYQLAGDRTVLGLPVRWPLIFTARQAGYVPRAHFVRLDYANIANNEQPHQNSDVRMIAVGSAAMNTKRVLLDPGPRRRLRGTHQSTPLSGVVCRA